MMTDNSKRPIPAEPLGGEPGPEWQIEAGALRKIASRIPHLDAFSSVAVENRGQGYMVLRYTDAHGELITESLMPGDDAT